MIIPNTHFIHSSLQRLIKVLERLNKATHKKKLESKWPTWTYFGILTLIFNWYWYHMCSFFLIHTFLITSLLRTVYHCLCCIDHIAPIELVLSLLSSQSNDAFLFCFCFSAQYDVFSVKRNIFLKQSLNSGMLKIFETKIKRLEFSSLRIP